MDENKTVARRDVITSMGLTGFGCVLGNLSMREILVMRSALRPSVRAYRLSGWRWGVRTASGTGMFGQFSLAGNRVVALHLATRLFPAGNHIMEFKHATFLSRRRQPEVSCFPF